MNGPINKPAWNGLCPRGQHGLDFEGQRCDLCTRIDALATVPPDSGLLLENMALLAESSFSESELLAIRMLLRKMRDGSRKHGSLNLLTDGRDWREEKLGELVDWLWYELFEQVQAEMRRRG